MQLVSLEVTDFRNITRAQLEPDPDGTTVIVGPNGAGKTSLLEAVAYLATLRSFRGSPREALVRRGTGRAILRASTDVDGRGVVIEAEIADDGRARTMVNRQQVRRRSELRDALRTTVFSPDDISVVREGPSERRRFLDEALTVLDAHAAGAVEEVDKILRQRGALLRNARRRLSESEATTLDVWDARLADAGERLVAARNELVAQLAPLVTAHYSRLAGTPVRVGLDYRCSWQGGLLEALYASREPDLVRGASLVGPHRDELDLSLDGLPGRTHASQGEQRSLAFALRLAAHQLATERLGSAPVLLLDDVFSELDPARSQALLGGLPPGQTLLTTTVPARGYGSAGRSVELEAGGRLRVTTAPGCER